MSTQSIIIFLFLIGCLFKVGLNTIVKLPLQVCNKLFCAYFFTICALFMGLRSLNVGVDTYAYYGIYTNISHYSILDLLFREADERTEIGYILLCKICNIFSDSYFFFQFVFSSIYCGLWGYAIYKYSRHPILCAAVFLGGGAYLLCFNVARQMMASILFAIGIMQLINKKYFRMFFLFFLSITFHATAIIAILLAFFLWLFRQNKLFIKISPFLILSITFLGPIMLDYASLIMGDNYANYYGNNKETLTAGFSKIVWIIDTLIATIIILSNTTIKEKLIAMYSLFFVVFCYIGLTFNLIDRMGLYFILFIILCYSNIWNFFKNRHIQILYMTGVITCFLFAFYLAFKTSQFSNYHFFFTE